MVNQHKNPLPVLKPPATEYINFVFINCSNDLISSGRYIKVDISGTLDKQI